MGSMAGVTPALLIAATHSGAGKTTATGAILRALCRRDLDVQAFKIGPDFIDAGYHAEATGRPSINLDVWMMGVDGVRRSFERWSAGADISVIEAMGALYDGENGSDRGSAAHVAKLLGVPVIVVLDVWGMTRTTGAILDGLQAFDPDVNIAGYILNRVGSGTHAQMINDALATRLRALVIGTIEHRPELAIPERHLGLITVDENGATSAAREEAFRQAAEGLDLDRLLSVAGVHPSPRATAPVAAPAVSSVARIAVAREAAFCFYYEENLLALRVAGFEVVPFRPTRDRRLPDGTDAVYLGGGYPESFAAELEANTSLAAELRERAAGGMPVYAECGGLMYLGRSLIGFDGVRHEMSGVLPIDIVMDPAYLRIRYVNVATRMPSPLGATGTTLRGQEFHQSRIVAADIEPTLFDVTASDGEATRDGYLVGNVVASYIHVHFASNATPVGQLLQSAVEARLQRQGRSIGASTA